MQAHEPPGGAGQLSSFFFSCHLGAGRGGETTAAVGSSARPWRLICSTLALCCLAGVGTKGDPDPQQPPAPNQQLAATVGTKRTAATAEAKSASSLSIVLEQSQPFGTARTKADPLEQQQTQPLFRGLERVFFPLVFGAAGRRKRLRKRGRGREGGGGGGWVELKSKPYLHCPTSPFSSQVSARTLRAQRRTRIAKTDACRSLVHITPQRRRHCLLSSGIEFFRLRRRRRKLCDLAHFLPSKRKSLISRFSPCRSPLKPPADPWRP